MEQIVEHVGHIHEKLELDSYNHYTTILLCEWVRASSNVRVPNTQPDKYGFKHMDNRVHEGSFRFPLHCQEVFFYDSNRHGWKIVNQTYVRGRRTAIQHQQPMANGIAFGNDVDF